MRKTEIEKMFEMEVRDKKRIGSNIYARTGTRGYTGTIRSAHDLLKGKAKKLYEGNSKVMTTNMYDKIISREEFDKLDLHIQKNMYSYWYLTHGIKKIQEGFNCGGQTVYNYLDKLGIPRKGKEGRKPRTAKIKPVEQTKRLELVPERAELDALNVAQEVEVNGMQLKFKGIYQAAQIQKILSKLDVLVTDEENDFYLNIEILEKKK